MTKVLWATSLLSLLWFSIESGGAILLAVIPIAAIVVFAAMLPASTELHL